jgi:hypothetical protein
MKVKVFNPNPFDVGVSLINPVREQNIKGGSFTVLDPDDIYYLNSICTLFKRGHLVVEDPEVRENLGFFEEEVTIKSKQEIEAILKGNFLKMKAELSKITEPHLIDLVYTIAKSISDDLNGSKLKYISQFCKREII